MNTLLEELEALRISGNLSNENLWTRCIELLERTFVPRQPVGTDRPCEEKDFREYRLVVDRNLRNVKCMLHHILQEQNERNMQIDYDAPVVKTFGIHLILVIGEQNEKNIWNSAESVSISNELKAGLCNLFRCENLSQFLMGQDDKLNVALLTLRPKLLKDSWKTYPAAVACYKWMLYQIQEPGLLNHIGSVLPTALIIFDDYIPENKLIGLECLNKIIQHASMKKELIETGYAEVIYDALERLTHQQEAKYIVPLYSCIANLLATSEFCNNFTNVFEWTKRDDILATLLDNMECQQDLELRYVYMSSLPQLLTHIGCAKWCERLTRVLAEYCEHHTDLRTLKATLEAAKTILLMFHPRISSHCVVLYTAFLKLHFDLIETPIFDKEIVQNLEDCICLLYKLTPTVGGAIMRDNRMRSVIKNTLQFVYLSDTKYFN